MIEVESRTTIGKGQPYHDRKYLGHYYVGNTTGRNAHLSPHCQRKRGPEEYRRLPVYEEDGQAQWYDFLTDKHGYTTVCDECPPQEFDVSWMDRGACYGTKEEGFFNGNSQTVIDQYCERCPVIRECLEYGIAKEKDNIGSIWGGVYFNTRPKKRAEDIRARLESLDLLE